MLLYTIKNKSIAVEVFFSFFVKQYISRKSIAVEVLFLSLLRQHHACAFKAASD